MNISSLLRRGVYPVAARSRRPGLASGAPSAQTSEETLAPPPETSPHGCPLSYAQAVILPVEQGMTGTEQIGRPGGVSPGIHTLVLADDHQVVRQSLKRLLNQQSGLQLIGESGNGLETLSLVKQLQPDLLVTDLMMPGMNGLEVTRRVRLSFPGTRVVVVSSNGDEPY